jgi:hypothetical protein
VAKHADHLPVHRQAKIFERQGVGVAGPDAVRLDAAMPPWCHHLPLRESEQPMRATQTCPACTTFIQSKKPSTTTTAPVESSSSAVSDAN